MKKILTLLTFVFLAFFANGQTDLEGTRTNWSDIRFIINENFDTIYFKVDSLGLEIDTINFRLDTVKNTQWDNVTGGINYAGGNVGIGITIPSTQLHIEGSTAGISLHRTGGAQPFIRLSNPTTTTGGQIRGIGNALGFIFTDVGGGTEWMRINASGFISIGGDDDTGLELGSSNNLSIKAGGIEAMLLTEDTVFVDSTIAPLQIKFPDGTIQTTAFILNDGLNNIFLGEFSGVDITTGQRNNTLGIQSGTSLTEGLDNIIIGSFAGDAITTGDDNTIIGSGAGGSLVTGDGNMFLGNEAGANETGSNKLYIDNSNTATPLIEGDFVTNTVTINDTLVVTGAIKGVMQIAKAQIVFTNTTQTTIIPVPSDAVIWEVGVNVVIDFDGSGNNNIEIGITGTVGKYATLTNTETSTTAFYSSTNSSLTVSNIPETFGSATNITYKYTDSNADAGQGTATVYIHYIVY